jgi:diguanylate cyclase (GGDEF)-like protein
MSDQVPAIERDRLLQDLSELCRRARTEESMLGLAIVDLRQFHRVNRVHGIAAGDRVLGTVLQRLATVDVRGARARRIGNDEFAVALPGMASAGLLSLIANRILRELDDPVAVDGEALYPGVNIGLACYPEGADSADELFFRAEQALRLAKARGASFLISDPARPGEHVDDARLNLDLHQAVQQEQLRLAYQPRIDLASGAVRGAEALLRWTHPQHGEVPPARFIPLIEESGRMADLTRWILNTALRDSREWPGDASCRTVAVNLSSSALRRVDLEETVASALRLWGRQASDLTLEVAEFLAMEDSEDLHQQLDLLRDLGIAIAVDDFGIGPSSLDRFKRLPATEVKIDRRFILSLLQDRGDLRIVRHLVALAHAFGMKVVAEGVEDRRTLAAVRKLGCDYAQGFLFGSAMTQDDFVDWLRAYEPASCA